MDKVIATSIMGKVGSFVLVSVLKSVDLREEKKGIIIFKRLSTARFASSAEQPDVI
ncbi:hypothetical protein SLEP1_g36387 [Rubroshorea leprosula]|uniref:Uncharacterized protein n=1 Tax=Rubroshorea leprosula TaxID=152421 RepID=A0AAV5KRB3_9ROSI|nr:hypothetical protein SLEP1_g36387 [Rubroshorea leprosula]